MVDFHLGRHKLVTAAVAFGWLLSVSVGFSRSLSNAFSVSTSRTFGFTTALDASDNDGNGDDTTCRSHYKWLVVGGGIHGVGIASRLVGTGTVSTDQLLVVDEHPSLLHSWKERTSATGMSFLRSSAGFHLDVPPEGLREFAGDYGSSNTKTTTAKRPISKKAARKAKNNRNQKTNPKGAFVGSDYQRPALKLFNDHCDLVVSKYGLKDSFFRGRVESIDGSSDSKAKVVIRNKLASNSNSNSNSKTTTTVSADNVVLAVGNDAPFFPEWATDLAKDDKSNKISHLLEIPSEDDSDSTSSIENNRSHSHSSGEPRVVAIIGGGISAVHKALQLISKDNVVVHIVSRHPVREQQFDTHQDWMMTNELAKRSLEKGGKGLTERQAHFRTIPGLVERREVIKRERVPGTVPTYMSRGGLKEGIAKKKIQWHIAEVASASSSSSSETSNGYYQLELTNGCNFASIDEIILATGLGKRPPGHSIIHPLAKEANLPLSPCGYPLVDEKLQWQSSNKSSSKIFVSGGLAELELGPSARNIAGARMAAERIVQRGSP